MPTLDFKGKQHVYAHHLSVPYRPLTPHPDKSVGAASGDAPSADDNLIIHGDNLHALKALLPRYAGRVKCIYIDPPYNTGNEGWVYNDNVNSPLMREWLSENGPVDNEDQQRHDKWLCMMWPRLQLLKELLSEDGTIFVSIDDNEQHHLRMLMDEIFGEDCFLAEFVWKSRQNRDNRNVTGASIDHEYILCYGTSIRGDDRKTDLYSNPDNDPRGDWASGNMVGLATIEARPNLHFNLIDPETGINYGCPPRGWRFDQGRMSKLISEGTIIWPESPEGRPRIKVFLKDLTNSFTGFSSVVGDGIFTRNGTREIMEIFDSRVIEFPKPHELVRQLTLQGCPEECIILDSFAGSGTTAHAVLDLNQSHGGNRKFILVECEDYADRITAERVRRVINGIPTAKDESLREGLGGSFTYCTLGAPIEIEGMLSGDALPAFPSLAAYLLHTASGIAAGESALEAQDDDGLFYSDDTTSYYLLYEPDVEYLRSHEAMLNDERAERIGAAGRLAGHKAIVFGAGKYIGQRELTDWGITFVQLPYQMHKKE